MLSHRFRYFRKPGADSARLCFTTLYFTTIGRPSIGSKPRVTQGGAPMPEERGGVRKGSACLVFRQGGEQAGQRRGDVAAAPDQPVLELEIEIGEDHRRDALRNLLQE